MVTATDRFDVPARRVTAELEIKRSRFIATVGHINDRGAFDELLQDQRQAWPDAGHHCWALVAGPPGDLRHADKSDDGEPRGTAGRPMLNVLEHSGLGYVGAIVTRYFGGIKLGAGGLVRAYGSSVSAALDILPTRVHFVVTTRHLSIPYALLASVEHWLASTDVDIADKRFADDVTLTLRVPLGQLDATATALAALVQRDLDWQADGDASATD